MAGEVNIFDKYGIKEVANVYFEALEDDLAANIYKGDIVLFLDTLKVSTIETSAENTAARGGWGNPRLIQWDYGKEITVTLTDALMSLESLRFMLGGAIKKPTSTDSIVVRHTAEVVVDANQKVPIPVDPVSKKKFDGIEGPVIKVTDVNHPIRVINLSKGWRTQLATLNDTIDGEHGIRFVNPKMIGTTVNDSTIVGVGQEAAVGDRLRIFWDEIITDATTLESAVEVTISPDTFPGTYRIVGDTFMRSADTGADEPFQFIINQAKVQSSVTITLEAEGDPSTFELSLNVLRATNEDGETEMMKLIRYKVGSSSGSVNSENDKGSIYVPSTL